VPKPEEVKPPVVEKNETVTEPIKEVKNETKPEPIKEVKNETIIVPPPTETKNQTDPPII